MLHMEGKDGIEAEFEGSEAFHDAWMLKSRDMLARAEFRRRKLVQRLQVHFLPHRIISNTFPRISAACKLSHVCPQGFEPH